MFESPHESASSSPDPALREAEAQYDQRETSVAALESSIGGHCLHCGYSRRGLLAEDRCPECGNFQHVEACRDECFALSRSLPRLVFRLGLFRRLPLGWWEVFREFDQARLPPARPWRTMLFAVLLLWLSSFLGAMVSVVGEKHTFYYAVGDPRQQPVADIQWERVWVGLHGTLLWGESRGPQVRAVARPDWKTTTKYMQHLTVGAQPRWLWDASSRTLMLTSFVCASWLLLRYVWLNTLMIRRDDLGAGDRASIRRAADRLAPIMLAHVLWCRGLGTVGFTVLAVGLPRLEVNTAYIYPELAFIVPLLLFPIPAWARAVTADRSGCVFSRKAWTWVLLLLTAIAAATAISGAVIGIFLALHEFG